MPAIHPAQREAAETGSRSGRPIKFDDIRVGDLISVLTFGVPRPDEPMVMKYTVVAIKKQDKIGGYGWHDSLADALDAYKVDPEVAFVPSGAFLAIQLHRRGLYQGAASYRAAVHKSQVEAAKPAGHLPNFLKKMVGEEEFGKKPHTEVNVTNGKVDEFFVNKPIIKYLLEVVDLPPSGDPILALWEEYKSLWAEDNDPEYDIIDMSEFEGHLKKAGFWARGFKPDNTYDYDTLLGGVIDFTIFSCYDSVHHIGDYILLKIHLGDGDVRGNYSDVELFVTDTDDFWDRQRTGALLCEKCGAIWYKSEEADDWACDTSVHTLEDLIEEKLLDADDKHHIMCPKCGKGRLGQRGEFDEKYVPKKAYSAAVHPRQRKATIKVGSIDFAVGDFVWFKKGKELDGVWVEEGTVGILYHEPKKGWMIVSLEGGLVVHLEDMAGISVYLERVTEQEIRETRGSSFIPGSSSVRLSAAVHSRQQDAMLPLSLVNWSKLRPGDLVRDPGYGVHGIITSVDKDRRWVYGVWDKTEKDVLYKFKHGEPGDGGYPGGDFVENHYLILRRGLYRGPVAYSAAVHKRQQDAALFWPEVDEGVPIKYVHVHAGDLISHMSGSTENGTYRRYYAVVVRKDPDSLNGAWHPNMDVALDLFNQDLQYPFDKSKEELSRSDLRLHRRGLKRGRTAYSAAVHSAQREAVGSYGPGSPISFDDIKPGDLITAVMKAGEGINVYAVVSVCSADMDGRYILVCGSWQRSVKTALLAFNDGLKGRFPWYANEFSDIRLLRRGLDVKADSYSAAVHTRQREAVDVILFPGGEPIEFDEIQVGDLIRFVVMGTLRDEERYTVVNERGEGFIKSSGFSVSEPGALHRFMSGDVGMMWYSKDLADIWLYQRGLCHRRPVSYSAVHSAQAEAAKPPPPPPLYTWANDNGSRQKLMRDFRITVDAAGLIIDIAAQEAGRAGGARFLELQGVDEDRKEIMVEIDSEKYGKEDAVYKWADTEDQADDMALVVVKLELKTTPEWYDWKLLKRFFNVNEDIIKDYIKGEGVWGDMDFANKLEKKDAKEKITELEAVLERSPDSEDIEEELEATEEWLEELERFSVVPLQDARIHEALEDPFAYFVSTECIVTSAEFYKQYGEIDIDNAAKAALARSGWAFFLRAVDDAAYKLRGRYEVYWRAD